MVQSRCGVCCESCERRDSVACTGCMTMKTPFWGGTCGVKGCCEKNGLAHCGLCPDFPCTMLSEMGKDQGFDPAPRLEQLRRWSDAK